MRFVLLAAFFLLSAPSVAWADFSVRVENKSDFYLHQVDIMVKAKGSNQWASCAGPQVHAGDAKKVNCRSNAKKWQRKFKYTIRCMLLEDVSGSCLGVSNDERVSFRGATRDFKRKKNGDFYKRNHLRDNPYYNFKVTNKMCGMPKNYTIQGKSFSLSKILSCRK